MSECSICCETFNKSSRSMINCQTCDSDIKVCQVCAKRYILDKPTDASTSSAVSDKHANRVFCCA